MTEPIENLEFAESLSRPELSENSAAAIERRLMARIDYERMRHVPYDSRRFNLDRMRWLLRLCGEPQRNYPIVHITGTKGKGSTAAIIESIFRAAGFRTGLFTSPHLTTIRERFRINGNPIDEEPFVRICTDYLDQIDSAKLDEIPSQKSPTYFEILTAVGMGLFSQKLVDIAILEVGLGGRFDATNVCDPELSIITSIDYDHCDQLGETLEKIAYEKAGILRSGVPAICGVTDPGPAVVIRNVANEVQTPLITVVQNKSFNDRNSNDSSHEDSNSFINRDYIYSDDRNSNGSNDSIFNGFNDMNSNCNSDIFFDTNNDSCFGTYNYRYTPARHLEVRESYGRIDFQMGNVRIDSVEISLPGAHQAANAACAIAAIYCLKQQPLESGKTERFYRVNRRDFLERVRSISETDIRRGLTNVQWPGRVEIVRRQPTIVFDAAHNPVSISALIRTLSESFESQRKILVFAATREKKLRKMVEIIHQYRFDTILLTRHSNIERAADLDKLFELFISFENRGENSAKLQSKIETFSSPQDAFQRAWKLAMPDDLICVTGSFYLLSDLWELKESLLSKRK